jgi:uncharacterized protein YjbI with pentapeptide repeats
VNFTAANLTHADLRGSKLTGSTFLRAQLEGAQTDEATQG